MTVTYTSTPMRVITPVMETHSIPIRIQSAVLTDISTSQKCFIKSSCPFENEDVCQLYMKASFSYSQNILCKASHSETIPIKIIAEVEKKSVFTFNEDDISDISISPFLFHNKIIIHWGYNWADGSYSYTDTFSDDISIAKDSLHEIEIFKQMLYSKQAIQRLGLLYLNAYVKRIVTISFKHDKRSYQVQIGDPVKVNLEWGIGENGWVAKKGIVTKKSFLKNDFQYEIRMSL